MEVFRGISETLSRPISQWKRTDWVLPASAVAIIWLVWPRRKQRDRERGEGLKTVHTGKNAHIIFVHGLGSEQTRAWSADNTCWPRDFLPEDIPDNSIHLYGYDSRWMWNAPIIDVEGLADKLVKVIEAFGADASLVFVAHSHGGLIVKEAVVRGNLSKRVRGILFFGTPHRGSSITAFASLIATLLFPFGGDGAILSSIQPRSDYVLDLHERFIDSLWPPPPVWNFYEGRSTVMLKILGMPIQRQIVDKSSATFILRNCNNILLQRDHKQLNKFSERDTDYLLVARLLKGCVRLKAEGSAVNDKEKQECIRSLAFDKMEARWDNVTRPEKGTADWLFETDEYQNWLNGQGPPNNGVLWIRGHPGAGKSTLMKHLVSQLKGQDFTMATFFFHARGGQLEKSPLGLYRAFVCQLIEQNQASCSSLVELWRTKLLRHESFFWTEPLLTHFLHQDLCHHQRLLLVVDALDECNDQEVSRVVKFLEFLSIEAQNTDCNLKIALSSRHYPHIDMKICLPLNIDQRQGHIRDIEIYIANKLEVPDFAAKILKKANGIFMWVLLVIELLNQAFRDGDVKIDEILSSLPSDLDSIYAALLERHGGGTSETLAAIIWVLFAKRPLTPIELYCAVKAQIEGKARILEPIETEAVILKSIRRWSLGLIEISDTKNSYRSGEPQRTVQFIHQTVTDFFLRQDRLSIIDPQLTPMVGSCYNRMVQTCENYIRTVNVSKVDLKGLATSAFNKYPLTLYATRGLLVFSNSAQQGGVSQEDFIERFREQSFLRAFKRLERRDLQWFSFVLRTTNYPMASRNNADEEAIHILMRYSAFSLLTTILHSGIDVNVRGGSFCTALHIAASKGNTEAIQQLLDAGADVNAQGGFFKTPLQATCRENYLHAARVLIEAGAEVNARNDNTSSPLNAACGSHIKSVTMVQLLLDAGAAINTKDNYIGSALHSAALRGYTDIVHILLEAGADLEAASYRFGKPLTAAAEQGNAETVKFLLDCGANVNASGGVYHRPLQAAAFSSTDSVEKIGLLLNAGAEVNAQGGHFGNALQAAAVSSVDPVEKIGLLLNAGAEVNAQGGHFGNALQAASVSREISKEGIGLLVDAGADLQAIGGQFGSAVQGAIFHGNNSNLEVLLDSGVDLNSQPNFEVLSDAGANVESQPSFFLISKPDLRRYRERIRMNYSPHSVYYHLEKFDLPPPEVENDRIVRLLLDAGADPKAEKGVLAHTLRAVRMVLRLAELESVEIPFFMNMEQRLLELGTLELELRDFDETSSMTSESSI